MSITFKQRTLANGLTIIAECDPSAHSAAAGFFVRTGARDEAPALMGVSHFLEHMMFKGTESLSAEQLNKSFDEIGARNNAYTSNEVTCFYAHVIPERLDRSLDLLGQMMRPALRQADFDTEKGVILEEIAMYKDNPFWVLYEAAIDRHYAPHPMSHRVLGTTDTITALQSEQMRTYFEDRYSADNTVVAIAGNADFERCCDRVEAVCGGWRRTGTSKTRSRPTPNAVQFELRDAKVNRGYLLALAPGPGVADDERYAAALLAQVLGMSDNSRLHWALVESGIAEEAQAAFDPHDGVGDYYIYASGDPGSLDEIWAIISEQCRTLVESATQDDLVRLRNKIATAATLGSERPSDRMQRLGRVWSSLGVHLPLEAELDRIERVTLEELRDVGARFPIAPRTVGRLLPAEA